MFRRRERVGFLHPKPELTAINGAATQRAGPFGTDSLDFLAAALESRKVADAVRRLGVDPAVVAAAADDARPSRDPNPGLTNDAKRVVEALGARALERGRDPSGLDLLLALAVADAAPKRVLGGFGIDEARIRAVAD